MEIIIDNFQRGIAQSPHEGFADMRNVVIDKKTGVAEINWKTKAVATAMGDFVKWFAHDKATGTAVNFYATTDSGKLFKSGNSGDSWIDFSGGHGRGGGLAVWKDHIIVSSASSLNAYGPISASPNWSTAFVSLAVDDTTHEPIIVGQDDIVYIGNNRYIASLQEVVGQNFTAGTASTYTFGTAALDLPEDYRIKTLEELGTNLFAGTWKGTTFEQPQVKTADIFPWDRTSDSFKLPIKLAENGVHWQITINNIIYFQAGLEGKIFATNGSSVKFITQIPKHITDIDGAKIIISSPAGVMLHRGKLYFAIASSRTTGEEIADGVGVWSLDLETGALIMENQLSTGTTFGIGTDAPKITALLSVSRNQYLIGFQDSAIGGGVSFGIDKVSNTERYTSYAARIDSQYFSVGTKNKPASFSELEFELAEPLRTGEGIRFFYRTNLRDAFTSIRTFDFATDGALQTGNTDFKVTTESGIQIRTELTTGSASTTTVSLKKVLIR